MTTSRPGRLRVAATGVSHWHSLHDSAYLRHVVAMPDAELVGLHDASAEIAGRRASALGGPPVFTDYRRLLEATRPDFVIALGRHCDMAEVALHLLDRGLPFMMEKPMGVGAAEVERVADRVAATGGFAAVPLIQRHHPFVARARELRDAGRFGPLSHVYLRINRPTSARYVGWEAAWMLDPAAAGGGCLRNLGSHVLDLFAVLTGEDAVVTGAQVSARGLGQPVEDYASVLVRSASGVLGTLEVGNMFPRSGTDGQFKVSGRDALLILEGETARVVTADGEASAPCRPAEPLALSALRDALDHWRRGLPPSAGVADCLRAVRLIDRAYALAARA